MTHIHTHTHGHEDYRCVRFRCADVFPSIPGKTKHEDCFKRGACYVTYGEAMNLAAARKFCAELPNTKSVLPTLSNRTRLLQFNAFLGTALNLTNKQPVWLDLHKSDTAGWSLTNRINVY